MSDLEIVIALPPDAAVAGAKKVTDEVAKTEAAAAKARGAYSALGETFRRVAEDQVRMAQESARAREAVDTLAGGFARLANQLRAEALRNTANAFAGLTEQIKREADMLERLHGPAIQAAKDMQTLEMLWKSGRISAQDYAKEIERLSRIVPAPQAGAGNALANQRGATQQAMDLVSLPSREQKRPSFSLAGGSGLMGAAPAIAGGAFVGKAVLDLSDSYTSLENRLRQVSGSQSDLNALMSRTREIADATRSDWKSTAEGFVRLTNATKAMGLSQDRALKITETLNMALQSSGASSSEAAAGTLQLMQALSAGALQGDEFRSIAEQLPDLLDLFAKEMGVSRGELKKLGAEGKISAEVVVASLENASDVIRDKFNASTATASQQWTLLKNQLTDTAGQFVRNSGVMEAFGSVVGKIGSALSVFTKITNGVHAAMDALGPVGDALGAILEGVMNPLGLVKDSWNALTDSFVDFALTAKSVDEVVTSITDELARMHETLSQGGIVSVEQFADRMKKLHDELSKPLPPEAWVHRLGPGGTTWTPRLAGGAVFGSGIGGDSDKNLAELIKGGKGNKSIKKEQESAAKAYAEMLEQQWEAANFDLAQELMARNRQRVIDVTYSAGAQGMFDDPFADVRGLDIAGLTNRARGTDGTRDRLTSAWFRELEEMRSRGIQVSADLSEGFGEVAESIASMAASGTQSFDQMVANMAASLLSLFATQGFQALGDILGWGATGAIGAGAASALPGFATGGMIMPGGSGGTDSQIVAFRKSPEETVRIHTPPQEAAFRSGAGGVAQTINVHVSERDMVRSLEVAGRPTIVRVVTEAFPQLRSPSGR